MASESAQIRVYECEGTVVFRIIGRVTMCHCPVLRSKTEECLGRGVRRLLVDLGECTYFDSTFLGTLLFMKRSAAEHGGVEFGLVDPSPECRRLLAQMRMECHFPQADAVDAPQQGCELRADYDAEAFKWSVVCAHQELAALPGGEGAGFRPLAERLAAELKASRPH